MSNGNGESRLDRIEAIIEAVATRQADIEAEFKRLLTAQVLLVDAQQKTEKTVSQLGEAQRRTEESLRTTQENLNALIGVVDDIVRKRPPQ